VSKSQLTSTYPWYATSLLGTAVQGFYMCSPGQWRGEGSIDVAVLPPISSSSVILNIIG